MAHEPGTNYCRNRRKCVPLHRGKDKARRILTLSAEKIFPLGREKKWSIKKGERSLTFCTTFNIQHYSYLSQTFSTPTTRISQKRIIFAPKFPSNTYLLWQDLSKKPPSISATQSWSSRTATMDWAARTDDESSKHTHPIR